MSELTTGKGHFDDLPRHNLQVELHLREHPLTDFRKEQATEVYQDNYVGFVEIHVMGASLGRVDDTRNSRRPLPLWVFCASRADVRDMAVEARDEAQSADEQGVPWESQAGQSVH